MSSELSKSCPEFSRVAQRCSQLLRVVRKTRGTDRRTDGRTDGRTDRPCVTTTRVRSVECRVELVGPAGERGNEVYLFSLLALCTPTAARPPAATLHRAPHHLSRPTRGERGKNSPNLFTFDPDFCSRRRRRHRRHGTSMISQGKIDLARECVRGER